MYISPGFHLRLKVWARVSAKCLATPTFVDHTPYYMLVHHSRSSYITDSNNVIMSNILGGRFSPPPTRWNPAYHAYQTFPIVGTGPSGAGVMATIDPLDQPEDGGWGDDDELIINEGKFIEPYRHWSTCTYSYVCAFLILYRTSLATSRNVNCKCYLPWWNSWNSYSLLQTIIMYRCTYILHAIDVYFPTIWILCS